MTAADDLRLAGRLPGDLYPPYDVSVDPRTGAATVRVALPTSPGRGDVGPALALTYRSSAGNSPFGLGWSLEGPAAVVRDTGEGVPRYDAGDGFSLGGEELAPWHDRVGGSWQPRVDVRGDFVVRRYRLRVEHVPLRVEQWVHAPTGRVHWRTRDVDDVVTVYGAEPGGRSRIADPDNPDRVYLWLPDAAYHRSGDVVRFEYEPETFDGVDLAAPFERRHIGTGLAQRYLKRIRYGNSVPFGPGEPDPAGLSWLFEVAFDYGDHSDPVAPDAVPDRAWAARPDPYSNCRAGFELRTYRLCRRVLQFHRFPELGAGATLVHVTAFDHELDPAGATLRGVTHTGHRRGGARRSQPALRFSYSTFAPAPAFEAAPEATVENAPRGVGGGRYRWVDLYGEGLPGIMAEGEDAWYYKPNLGGGRFGAQQVVLDRPTQRVGAFALGDVDGDGNTELVVQYGRQAGYYALDRNTGRWDGFRPFVDMPHVESAGTKAQFVDLTGDGRPDLVVSHDDRITWYRSRGIEGFDAPADIAKPAGGPTSPSPHLAEDDDLDFFFADMNGDGLVDLVRVGEGRVEYWPQHGHGRFGDAVLMEGGPGAGPAPGPGGFDSTRVRLADLDGTGTTDVVYLGAGEVRIWANAGGNRLVERPPLLGLPFVEDLAHVAVVDFLGNGTPSLVWSSALPGAPPLRSLPLTGGVRPRLLVAVENGMGGYP